MPEINEINSKILEEIKNEELKSNEIYDSFLSQDKSNVVINEKDVVSIKKIIEDNSDDFGFTKLSEIDIFENIIVIIKEMNLTDIKVPTEEALTVFLDTYLDLDRSAAKIVDYINSLGYKAYSKTSMFGEDEFRRNKINKINYSLIAESARLGYIGKNGLLLSNKFGTNHRITVIFTNISNLYKDNIINKNYCLNCNLCVDSCPAGAIHGDDLHTVDYNKCYRMFDANFACGVCIKVCPVVNLKLKDKGIE